MHTKQAPSNNNIQSRLLDQTAKYESVFINRRGTPLQLVRLKTFTEKFHIGTKHHVKMIQHPLLITMQQKFGRDRNLSKQLKRKERKFDDGHIPASYRKQDSIGWVDKLACTSCVENS
jgi:hypothetical protein